MCLEWTVKAKFTISENITCASFPCENEGTCLDLDTGGVDCQCPIGYEGDMCEKGKEISLFKINL